ncbi:hypothetical protein EVAR_21138_1 [Eumeta japonica]|uniref:Uncharacterized protein n=1 Tax=Eumeta variegata TaxID=151549 RepID=A0A4C1VW60_EUMVA|nr:hypothetical protein EVAR_21138_1 [Eumeta japonica]
MAALPRPPPLQVGGYRRFYCQRILFSCSHERLDSLRCPITDAHWCFRDWTPSVRDLELPTFSKYIKDASKRFLDIAGYHPNALLRAVVEYEPPHSSHFIRWPRNVPNDPPDALTAAVESLDDVNDTHD